MKADGGVHSALSKPHVPSEPQHPLCKDILATLSPN